MSKINISSGFNPKMPAPVADLKIISPGSGMLIIQYSGFTIFCTGDFIDQGPTADPTGNVYKLSIGGTTGNFIAEGFTFTVADVLSAARSLDLTALVQRISAGDDTVSGFGELFGGPGNDLFENASKGPFFGGSGVDTYVSFQMSSSITVTNTELGTVLKPQFGEEILLVGIEKVKFADKTVDISPAATLYDYAAAARGAILRESSNDFLSYQDGKAGTKSAVATALMTKAEDSTLPAVIVYQEILGKTPGSAHLDSLAAFVKEQVNSVGYQSTANPRLGGYEAMGLALSGTPEFASKFGAESDVATVSAEYQHLFGRAATAVQVEHFIGQIDYFKALYVGAGIAASDAAIKARGAVVGQMLGYAAGEKADIHDAAVSFLMKATDGTASYGSPLEMI